MAKVNMNKSTAAKAAGQSGGLHNQRRGRKSVELQDEMVRLASKFPGYTINQLAWIAAGFHVDSKGLCQPCDKYLQIQKYFNAKRRGAEIAFHADSLSDHPRARLVYVKAVKNPYTESGGSGVRVIAGRSVSADAYQSARGGESVVSEQPAVVKREEAAAVEPPKRFASGQAVADLAAGLAADLD